MSSSSQIFKMARGNPSGRSIACSIQPPRSIVVIGLAPIMPPPPLPHVPWRKTTDTLRVNMFRPVVIRLGHYGNHILNLLLQSERRPSRQKEHTPLAPHTNILHHNRTQQPQPHLLAFTPQ